MTAAKPPEKTENAPNRFPRNFSIVFSIVFILLYWPGAVMLPFNGVFTGMENTWMDMLFVLRQDKIAEGDPRIILAAMDDDSVKKYGFPLPRNIHAKLLDRLKSMGTQTVAFDVIMSEDREHDAELIAATKRFKRVINLFTTQATQTQHGEVVEVRLPIQGLFDASQYLGYPNIDLMLDSDGHLRRSMMFDSRTNDPRNTDAIAPSMDIAAAASFLDKPISEFYAAYAEPEPRVMLINFRKPKEWLIHEKRDQGQVGKVANLPVWPSPYRVISYMDIVDGELSLAQKKALRGALVLVGSTTLGYFDHYANPFTPQSPGVEYHANNIDNMFHGDYLESTGRGVILLIILFMIWFPIFLQKTSPTVGSGATMGVLLGWLGFCYWNFTSGVRTDFVAPSAALFISFMVQTVYRVFTEGAEKRYIKNLMGQFVAPEIVEDLASDPSKVKLGGESRDLTIFFLDIAHFTNISEKLTPEALIQFLNNYLRPLSNIILEEKGVVDKYIGDCIMAFWNAPKDVPNHRARACMAAVECQKIIVELNKQFAADLPEVPHIRIGLNSGTATVGLTGTEKKLQYTALGDEVNLSSRLEGANKFFGSGIMASEATYGGAKDQVEARELGRVRVVGKNIPIKVYELLAKKGELSEDWKKALPLYTKGVESFNKREFEQAKGCFEQVIKIFPKDGPAALYLNVSTDYSAIPPPEDWDGVFNLTAK